MLPAAVHCGRFSGSHWQLLRCDLCCTTSVPLFSLFPYLLSLVIAHIVRGISIQSADILLLSAVSQRG
jgi:hypothetical protein